MNKKLLGVASLLVLFGLASCGQAKATTGIDSYSKDNVYAYYFRQQTGQYFMLYDGKDNWSFQDDDILYEGNLYENTGDGVLFVHYTKTGSISESIEFISVIYNKA